jgi:hypothetical protein
VVEIFTGDLIPDKEEKRKKTKPQINAEYADQR